MISHKLSMIKSILWRVMGVFIYAAVFYFFNGKFQLTIKSTLTHHTTFLLVFYLHERFWIWLKKPNSPIKAWTYEIILGMGLGGLIVYYFTGTWKTVTLITGTYTVIKIITYYINEKVWSKIESKKQ